MKLLDENLLRECLATYPERPDLDQSEWPYARTELAEAIGQHMEVIASLLGGKA